jgi:hypothetical protein
VSALRSREFQLGKRPRRLTGIRIFTLPTASRLHRLIGGYITATVGLSGSIHNLRRPVRPLRIGLAESSVLLVWTALRKGVAEGGRAARVVAALRARRDQVHTYSILALTGAKGWEVLD